MMDAKPHAAVEDFVHAGFPRDAEAVLLVEVDGLLDGVAEQADAVARDRRRARRGVARVAADDAERALLWKGRKSAFGAVARIAPDYYLHDAVVPRTKLVEVIRQVYEIADDHLIAMNVFHAGDGNLHPLLVFDGREPGVWERVHAAGDEILAVCIDAGGVLSGEHGIGSRSARLMPLLFSPDDLDGQARLRDAFDPDGAANPARSCRAAAAAASCSGCRRARGSERAVRGGRRRARGRRGRRADAMGTRCASRRRQRSRVHRRESLRANPTDMTITVGAGTPVAEIVARAGRARAGVRARPRDTGATVGGAWHPGSRACGGSGTARSATRCSRCASSPATEES